MIQTVPSTTLSISPTAPAVWLCTVAALHWYWLTCSLVDRTTHLLWLLLTVQDNMDRGVISWWWHMMVRYFTLYIESFITFYVYIVLGQVFNISWRFYQNVILIADWEVKRLTSQHTITLFFNTATTITNPSSCALLHCYSQCQWWWQWASIQHYYQ